MKSYTVLTVALSVFFSVLTCVVYNSISEVEQVPAAGDEAGVRDLVRRFETVQARLDRVATSVEELSRQGTPPTVAALAEAGTPVASGNEKKPAGSSSPGPVGSTGERLAALLELQGGEEDVRRYVAGIIDDDRMAQKKIQRQRQEERRAMFKGPYGRYNFRVNSLAGKLDLGDGQKDKYHELLQHYGKEAELLRTAGPDGKPFWQLGDPEQIQVHVQNMAQQRKNLSADLDREFVQFLEQDQARAYLDLPENERGLGGAMGAFHHFEVSNDGARSVEVHIGSTEVIDNGDLRGKIKLSIPPIVIPSQPAGNEDE